MTYNTDIQKKELGFVLRLQSGIKSVRDQAILPTPGVYYMLQGDTQ